MVDDFIYQFQSQVCHCSVATVGCASGLCSYIASLIRVLQLTFSPRVANRLWDMVDEFIYQFQSFAQYRGKLAQKSPHELELLKKCDGVWDLQGVLHYLHGLIDKSNILQVLSSDGEHL